MRHTNWSSQCCGKPRQEFKKLQIHGFRGHLSRIDVELNLVRCKEVAVHLDRADHDSEQDRIHLSQSVRMLKSLNLRIDRLVAMAYIAGISRGAKRGEKAGPNDFVSAKNVDITERTVSNEFIGDRLPSWDWRGHDAVCLGSDCRNGTWDAEVE